MSTATLETPVLPEKLYPQRGRLVKTLALYERAAADLEDYRGKAARYSIDEQAALDDARLSELEAGDRIARAQSQQAVYRARIASREKALSTLFEELVSSVKSANQELSALVSKELGRRREIIGTRALEALEAVNQPGRDMFLADMLTYSGPIQRIEALEPAPFTDFGNADFVLQTAKSTLTKFEQVIEEAAKKI